MTVSELVTRALRLAGVVGRGRSPAAHEMSDGITTLNSMVAQWKVDGIDLGLATLAQADTIYVVPAHLQALEFNLAGRMAIFYGVELSPAIVALAADGERVLRNSLFEIDHLRSDAAFTNRPTDFDFTNG